MFKQLCHVRPLSWNHSIDLRRLRILFDEKCSDYLKQSLKKSWHSADSPFGRGGGFFAFAICNSVWIYREKQVIRSHNDKIIDYLIAAVVPRRSTGCHLNNYASNAPNIWKSTELFLHYNFRRHPIRGPFQRIHCVSFDQIVHLFRASEIC